MPPDDPATGVIGVGPDGSADREWHHRVLLLITMLLVVAGVVLLIVGYVRSSMVTLYASIGCAAVAGVILIVVGRLNRRRAVAVAAGVDTAGVPEDPDGGQPPGAVPSEPPAAGVAEDADGGQAPGADPSETAAAGPEPGSAGDQPGQESTPA